MDRKTVNILNVSLDSTSLSGVLRFVRSSLEKKTSKHKFFIATPNPEHLMLAQEDGEFRKILGSADVSIPDGIGLVAAHKFLTLPNPKDRPLRVITLLAQGLGIGFSVLFDRAWLEKDGLELIKGREVFVELIKLANKKGWRVYLLGGEGDEAENAKLELEKSYKKIQITADKGPVLDNNGLPRAKKDVEVESKAVREINTAKPELLFVGMGAPKQEKWLYRNLKKLNIGGAMVVGGTFRYVSGEAKLPPDFVSSLNLEWLWRLFTGSQKPSRILTAFPKFALEVYTDKLRS